MVLRNNCPGKWRGPRSRARRGLQAQGGDPRGAGRAEALGLACTPGSDTVSWPAPHSAGPGLCAEVRSCT